MNKLLLIAFGLMSVVIVEQTIVIVKMKEHIDVIHNAVEILMDESLQKDVDDTFVSIIQDLDDPDE